MQKRKIPGSSATRQPRFRSLDGLRGAAASVVLVHHALLLLPAFSDANRGGPVPEIGSTLWWLNYSPLKLITAGGEAVIIFFVLSGLVVSLPVLTRAKFDWVAYYPQRALRLFLPIIGSIILAGVLIKLVPQNAGEGASSWIQSYSTPNLTIAKVFAATNLFGPTSNLQINNPLWSLRWELLFSLALPIFVVLALLTKRWWIVAGASAIIVTIIGRHLTFEPLDFLPAFFLGSLLAVNLDTLRSVIDKINLLRLRHLIWAAFTIAGSLIVISRWLTGPLPPDLISVSQALTALAPFGASMIIIACIGWSVLDWILSTRLFQFAGKVSFSLYLVHVPILIFVSHWLHGLPLLTVIAVGAALSIVTSVLFYWLIESRCHRFSRWVGRRASERMASHNKTAVAEL